MIYSRRFGGWVCAEQRRCRWCSRRAAGCWDWSPALTSWRSTRRRSPRVAGTWLPAGPISIADGHGVAHPKRSRPPVHCILAEHHLVTPNPKLREGPERLLAPLGSGLIGGGDHATGAGLHHVELEA